MSREKSHIDQKILERIKKAYNIDTDRALADFLGVKQNTIATWKRRNSYNLELILSKCDSLSADWLIYGEGEPRKRNTGRSNYNQSNQDLDDLKKKGRQFAETIENLPLPVETRKAILEAYIRIVDEELSELREEKKPENRRPSLEKH
jgi:hypothetical protein